MDNSSKKVLIAGCGNIGSFTVSFIARDPLVKKIVIVDHDDVEEKNLSCQDFCKADIGRKKSDVAAGKLRDTRPNLDVEYICDRVQNLPLGKFRCDVILGCFDNNAARQYLSETAFMLGIPYIDAGVNADGENWLARVNVYIPGADTAPCHQCGWGKMHYEQLEQEYPCGNGNVPAAINSPSFLGAQAAAVQAAECAKVLRGEADRIAAGRQIMFDMSFNKYYVTKLAPNPNCRFDHNILQVEMLDRGPFEITVGSAMKLGGGQGSIGSLELWGGRAFFCGSYNCRKCGSKDDVLSASVLFPDKYCEHCGTKNDPESLELVPRLNAETLPGFLLSKPLGDIGLRAGDVFSVTNGNMVRKNFEIGDLT